MQCKNHVLQHIELINEDLSHNFTYKNNKMLENICNNASMYNFPCCSKI